MKAGDLMSQLGGRPSRTDAVGGFELDLGIGRARKLLVGLSIGVGAL